MENELINFCKIRELSIEAVLLDEKFGRDWNKEDFIAMDYKENGDIFLVFRRFEGIDEFWEDVTIKMDGAGSGRVKFLQEHIALTKTNRAKKESRRKLYLELKKEFDGE